MSKENIRYKNSFNIRGHKQQTVKLICEKFDSSQKSHIADMNQGYNFIGLNSECPFSWSN